MVVAAMQDASDRLVHLYANVCCHGSAELAELELKSELRSQLKMERCAPIQIHFQQPRIEGTEQYRVLAESGKVFHDARPSVLQGWYGTWELCPAAVRH